MKLKSDFSKYNPINEYNPEKIDQFKNGTDTELREMLIENCALIRVKFEKYQHIFYYEPVTKFIEK